MNQRRIPQPHPDDDDDGRDKKLIQLAGLEMAFCFVSCSLELIKYENGDFFLPPRLLFRHIFSSRNPFAESNGKYLDDKRSSTMFLHN